MQQLQLMQQQKEHTQQNLEVHVTKVKDKGPPINLVEKCQSTGFYPTIKVKLMKGRKEDLTTFISTGKTQLWLGEVLHYFISLKGQL